MAKKTTPPPPPVGEPQISPERGLALLDEQIKKWKALDSGGSVSGEDVGDLWSETKYVLELTFGENSKQVKCFIEIPPIWVSMKRARLGQQPRSEWFAHRTPDESEKKQEDAKYRAEDNQERLKALQRIWKNLKINLKEVPPSAVSPQSQVRGNKIFLVHGHDPATKLEVADFLLKVTGESPIILHKQADEGRVTIEKFEDKASDAGFAVVLLTADDEGNAKGESPKPRARQNVIFELGYFIGKLGRNRICILYEKGVELPSDYEGVLYIEIGKDNWLLNLAKEIKAAGFQADMNLM